MINLEQSIKLTVCPTRIPASGKKLINIGGIWFFVREAKGLVQVYLKDTGELILVSANGRRKALNQLTERLGDVHEYINRKRAASL